MPGTVSSPIAPREARASELAEHLASLPVVALVAPGGYGKTTLLGLALARTEITVVRHTAALWHASDFAAPLVAAIRESRPDFGRLTGALAKRRPERETDAWSQELGATFARELDFVREPLVIAIDDVHVLAEDAAFAAFIASATRLLPSHVHLALSGRALPQLPVAEWIAAGRARVFGVEEIRLDDSDLEEVAHVFGRTLSAAERDELAATYRGWSAGVALALGSGTLAVPSPDGTLAARSAYLLDVNLATLDRKLVDFLAETAVFETLDAPLLERDPAFDRARAHIAELQRRGLMLEVVKAGEIYRVHPLLREALIGRLRLRGSSALAAAHARAAALLERSGRIAEALFHVEAAGDDGALARFIGVHAYESFIAGHGERIARTSRRLARAGVDAPATFALIDGMIARQRGEPGADVAFARGIAAARPGEPAGVACRMLLIEDKLARRQPVDGDLLQTLAAYAPHDDRVAINARMFAGWSDAIEGRFEEARANAERALAMAGDDLVARTRVVSLDAYAAMALGDIAAADATMATNLRELESSEHVVLLANSLVWYARFALLWDDAAAARDYAERGIALARRLDLPAEIAGAQLALADVFARAGERERCERAAAEAVRRSSSAWYAADRLRAPALAAACVARAAFARGELDDAATKVAAMLATEGVPEAQRAALAADAAGYDALRNAAMPGALLETLAAQVRDALATDALDAVALSDAAAIVAALGTRAGRTIDASPRGGIAYHFAAFLTQRLERAKREDRGDAVLRALLSPAADGERRQTKPRGSALTPREEEILQLIATGLTNREIAQRFTLSPRTVDTHVERVLSKLGATSRTRAVAIALRTGLVSAQPPFAS